MQTRLLSAFYKVDSLNCQTFAAAQIKEHEKKSLELFCGCVSVFTSWAIAPKL